MNGREDQVILEVLAGAEPPAGVATVDEPTLWRLYTELLGVLPHALDPVEPRPEVRERLLRTLREGAAGGGAAAPPAAPSEAPVPGFPSAGRPGASRSGPAATAVISEPRPAPRWPLALAAAFLLAALGLSGLLFSRLQDARSRLAQREADLAALAARGEQQAADLATLRAELEEVSGKLGLITQAGAEACLLLPPAGPGQGRGIVYIAANHQHWLLRVTGLPPVPGDRTYQMWFVTDRGSISAGTFRTVAGADAEIGSPTMPGGITGFSVTVEPVGGAQAPTGEPVLFGNQPQRLL